MTLTPKAFARATISIRFRDETACAILQPKALVTPHLLECLDLDEFSLCGVSLVVHQEKFEVAGVVDEERLVAGWHHVAGLPVVAIADLQFEHRQHPFFFFFLHPCNFKCDILRALAQSLLTPPPTPIQ